MAAISISFISEKLVAAIATLKKEVLDWQFAFIRARKVGKDHQKQYPHYPFYVHILNLYHLFEFSLLVFKIMVLLSRGMIGQAFLLVTNECSCSSKGATEYARSMFMFDHLLRYWIRLGLPIIDLFNWNHTIFSEESGEVALSVLSHSQPPTKRSDLKNAQGYWLLTRQRYFAGRQGEDLQRHKKASRCWYLRFLLSYSLLTQVILQFSG